MGWLGLGLLLAGVPELLGAGGEAHDHAAHAPHGVEGGDPSWGFLGGIL